MSVTTTAILGLLITGFTALVNFAMLRQKAIGRPLAVFCRSAIALSVLCAGALTAQLMPTPLVLVIAIAVITCATYATTRFVEAIRNLTSSGL